ncbi:MAG: hypothetical protein MK102_03630 [Fuerstiella sp.]|nr:hypothetical protein [Fuerstiella sp.]
MNEQRANDPQHVDKACHNPRLMLNKTWPNDDAVSYASWHFATQQTSG